MDEPDIVAMADAPARRRVTVEGTVSRMRTVPSRGLPSLAVTVADGSGAVTAVWTGRRALGGVTLGRRLRLTGVAVSRGGHLEFTNPEYTLLR